MTIKKQGGIFGRNSKFNDADATGTITSEALTVDTNTLHVDATNHRVGIGTNTPNNQLNIEDTSDVRVDIKSTGTGDADATLSLDSADTGESVINFLHDGALGAKVEWFTDGNPDLNIGTFGVGSVIDLQPNEVNTLRAEEGTVTVTGDLNVTGSVDGRDVATDGTKLDGIEANADVTNATNVTAAGALMDSEVTNLEQVKTFDSADYATAAQGTLADSALQPGDNVSELTNDAGYTTNIGDITGVTAGSGLTGGGTSGSVSLNVGAGTGVTVAADTVSIGQSVATSDSPTFAGLTVDTTTLYVDATNHRVGIGTLTPNNQLNIEDTGDVRVGIKSTGTGDADATLSLDSADTGESVLSFYHDGVLGAEIEWFTDGNPDLNITTEAGTDGVIDLQPNGVNTLRAEEGTVTVTGDLTVTGTVDGRDVAADGSKLDGIEAGANITDTANVTAAGALMDSEVTNLAQVKAFDSADYATAAQGSLADSALQSGDNISDLTNDAGYTTNVGDITGVTAGSGITGGGTSGTVTINHADTSSQSSVNNSNGTVIQDITLDTFGHLTGISSVNLDGRYYTETEADSRFVNTAGDTMTGTLTGPNLRLTDTGDASPTSTNHAFQIGPTSGQNIIFDANEIMGRNNGAVSDLNLNADGGDVQIHNNTTAGVFTIGGNNVFHDGYHPNADTLTTARTINGVSFNGSANITVADATKLPLSGGTLTGDLTIPSNIIHAGDTDTYIQFGTNEFNVYTGGSREITVNTTGVRLGDTGNGYFQPVSGSYGSIQIDAGAHGGYEGYSIGGRVVFMHNNDSVAGLFNDVNNEWLIRADLNGSCQLYYDGASKIITTNTGISMYGQIDMNNNDIVGVDQIKHEADADTYIHFHESDQWRVVTGGAERLEVNNTYTTIQNKAIFTYVNWDNSGTNTLVNSHQVSSVSDLATGSFRTNFSSAFPAATYAPAGMSNTSGGSNIPSIGFNTSSGTNYTTTSCGHSAEDVDGGYTDYNNNCVMYIGG